MSVPTSIVSFVLPYCHRLLWYFCKFIIVHEYSLYKRNTKLRMTKMLYTEICRYNLIFRTVAAISTCYRIMLMIHLNLHICIGIESGYTAVYISIIFIDKILNSYISNVWKMFLQKDYQTVLAVSFCSNFLVFSVFYLIICLY